MYYGVPCAGMNKILDWFDDQCMQGKDGLSGSFEDNDIYVKVDGYTDYGRELVIYRKTLFFRFRVLTAVRNMNEWFIVSMRDGEWLGKYFDK